MECQDCPIQELLKIMRSSKFEDKPLTEYEELTKPIGELCVRCSRGCRTCKIEKKRQAIRRKIAEGHVKMSKEERDKLAETLRKLNDTCATKCTHSADDNPSNHGQTFVSMDSGTCCKYSSDNSDSQNLALADYIEEHRVVDTHEQDPDGCTLLPPNVEDRLRKVLSAFNSLSFEDQCLILCKMKGLTPTYYGSMKWVPEAFTRTMTKQAANSRWGKLLEKLPFLAVLSVQSTSEHEATDGTEPLDGLPQKPVAKGREHAAPAKKPAVAKKKKKCYNDNQGDFFALMDGTADTKGSDRRVRDAMKPSVRKPAPKPVQKTAAKKPVKKVLSHSAKAKKPLPKNQKAKAKKGKRK